MTKDQLATATLDAIKARAIELESPLSDEDAAALGTMMASADTGDVTEEKFNSTMEQLKKMPKEQFDGMLLMAKMMGGGGVDAMAEQMAAAMGGATGGAMGGAMGGEEKEKEPVGEPTEEEKEQFNKFDEAGKNIGEWRMSIPRTVNIDELIALLHKFKNYPNTRWPKKPETVYVDKIVMAIRGCSSVVKSRQDAAVTAGVVQPLVEVLTGCHSTDKETCVRTTQCILGVCGNNEDGMCRFVLCYFVYLLHYSNSKTNTPIIHPLFSSLIFIPYFHLSFISLSSLFHPCP